MTQDNKKFTNSHRRIVANTWYILDQLGLVDTIFNHISIAAADSKGNFKMFMNPSGRLPEELSPKDICVFPLKEYLPSDAIHLGVIADGLPLHSAIHSLRMKNGAIIHTHSPYAIAVGCSKDGLQALSQTAMEFIGELETIEYEGMFRSQTLSEQLTKLASHGGVALLRHHGALVVADTIQEAFYLAYYIEEACKIQVLTLSQGVQTIMPDPLAIEKAHQALRADRENIAIQLFEAFCRKIRD